MKQTAVEWLENEFQEIFKEWGGLDTNCLKRFEQAKAMEKEQIFKVYFHGWSNGIQGNFISQEEYYIENFKSE